jgi:formate hydrogenlyase subunit 5
MNNQNNFNNLLLNKLCQEYFESESEDTLYLPVSEKDLLQLVPLLPGVEVVLIGLFCVEDFTDIKGFSLFYVLEKRNSRTIVVLQLRLSGKESPSVAEYLPSACWFEREIRDGFGIEFNNSFDKRRLFLHEVYPQNFHPLLKSFQNQNLNETRKNLVPGTNYLFKEVRGNGVYQVAVGPVHAGIIEPGHFRFSVIGETIANLELRMFYKHRGIEKLVEGKKPSDVTWIAETISGDETAANTVAFCLAVERISGLKVPERAVYLRTILLEMERICSHLGDLAGMIVDVGFPNGASDFHILREEILRYNEVLSGSRFLKGILCIGGLNKNIPVNTLMMLSSYLDSFRKRLLGAVKFVMTRDSVIDRLETTGIVRADLINPLNLTGPVARASGTAIDTRIDHPYLIYNLLELRKRTAATGDVLARFEVKADEVLDSVRLIQKLIETPKSGTIKAEGPILDGYALVLVEAARGQNLHWVYIRNGVIDRYKVRTASFCNWQAIEHAVIGNIVPDFPLINKSMNLSYAGTDL